MDNLYSSLNCNQFKVGAHHNIEGMVIVFADQEPALPGDVQLYGESHLGSEAGHAALASYSCLSIFPSSSTGNLEANLTTLPS